MGRLIITNTRTTGSTSWTYIPLHFYCRTVRITGTGANTLCAQHRVEVEQDLEQEVVFQKELIVPVFQVQTLKQHLVTNMYVKLQKKFKSSLYSRYFAEACNKWLGPKKRDCGGEPMATHC